MDYTFPKAYVKPEVHRHGCVRRNGLIVTEKLIKSNGAVGFEPTTFQFT